MSVRDDLIAAKALIADPDHWIKDNWGDDKKRSFCAWGAARSISGWSEGELGDPLVRALTEELPVGEYLTEFNDKPTTTHADIMALFQRAIEAAS